MKTDKFSINWFYKTFAPVTLNMKEGLDGRPNMASVIYRTSFSKCNNFDMEFLQLNFTHSGIEVENWDIL